MRNILFALGLLLFELVPPRFEFALCVAPVAPPRNIDAGG
jgi:hypothetical protein